MDLKSFASAISQIAEEKGIVREKVIEVIETALAAAYKKEYARKGQNIKAKLNPETGDVRFWQVKLVVDESMLKEETEEQSDKGTEDIKEKEQKNQKTEKQPEEPSVEQSGKEIDGAEEERKFRFNEEKHIMIEEAKKIKGDVNLGDELEFPLETHDDFGRIAAQTAKQVIIQRLREAEKEAIFGEFKTKEEEIVSGVIQRIEERTVFLDLGRTTGILLPPEQIPNEFYRIGQRLRLYVLRVEMGPKEPMVFLSRAYPKFLTKLFELEVPEVSGGTVIINSIAREAGSRSKVAASSTDQKIDPIGSMVGQRGSRILTVINELGGEKIDIIEWSDDPEKYIANALSPAKVIEIKINKKKNLAQAIVPEDQVSLAIGRDGQNVRLAAKLTGWKIDIRSAKKPEESVLPEELTKEVEETVEKTEETEKAGGKEAKMPKEKEAKEKPKRKKKAEKSE